MTTSNTSIRKKLHLYITNTKHH